MAKKVYVGIGHGGYDSGAVANGFKEDALALEIGVACYNELERCGINAKISRTTDVYKSISAKVAESNAFGADMCIDIHINAGGGDGSECYYRSMSLAAKKAATAIVNTCKSEVGQNTRGVKIKLNSKGNADYFGMIRSPKAPVSLLMECFFIDNMTDLAIGDTYAERQKFGKAIAHGILNFYGIAIKAESKPTTANATTSYRVKVTATNLNIRNGAGTNYAIVGKITNKGVYTITETKNGWGKLKSGVGWISLYYTKKV